jgi:hypothetical protein
VNRRKLIGLVAALLVAAVGTLVVLKSGDSTPAPAPVAAEPLVKVLKVVKQVPKGTPIAQLGDYVTVIDVPASQQGPNDAASLEDFGDKTMVANSDLFPEDKVSKLRFESPTKLSSSDIVSGAGGGEATDETTLVGVWVNLPPLNALNGNLKPGVTKVAVFAAFEPLPGLGSDPSKDVSTNHMIAHQVPVLDMYPPAGIPVAAAAPAEGQPAAAAPPLPASIQVKLGLDPATAERVIFTQMKGTIYLGEEGLAVEAGDTKVVERGNVYEPTQKEAPVKSPTAPKPVPQLGSGANPSAAVDPQASTSGTSGTSGKPAVVAPKPVTSPAEPKPVAAAPQLASATQTPAVATPATVK